MNLTLAHWIMGVFLVILQEKTQASFFHTIVPKPVVIPDFSSEYPKLEEIFRYLQQKSMAFADLISLERIQNAKSGFFYLKLSHPSSQLKQKRAVVLVGGHHGDEKISVTAVLAIVEFLSQHRHEPQIDFLLREFDIYAIPVLNAHGYEKCYRFNSHLVDINRDYLTAQPFQSQEAMLMIQLLTQVKPFGALSFHSGSEFILYPWCHSHENPSDIQAFESLGYKIAQAMQRRAVAQCIHDYQTEGEFIDYAYGNFGTKAFTIEISSRKNPHGFEHHLRLQQSVYGTLAFLLGLSDLAHDKPSPEKTLKPHPPHLPKSAPFHVH